MSMINSMFIMDLLRDGQPPEKENVGCAVNGCDKDSVVILGFDCGSYSFCEEHFNNAVMVQGLDNEEVELQKVLRGER